MVTFDVERGDTVGSRRGEGPSLDETGEMGVSSGLAIRKPPRDWARLRSPSIMSGRGSNSSSL